MEEGRTAFKILTGKPIGKRALGRPRSRWEDNIRMDLDDHAEGLTLFSRNVLHLDLRSAKFLMMSVAK